MSYIWTIKHYRECYECYECYESFQFNFLLLKSPFIGVINYDWNLLSSYLL